MREESSRKAGKQQDADEQDLDTASKLLRFFFVGFTKKPMEIEFVALHSSLEKS
jgi:hypothetical protein